MSSMVREVAQVAWSVCKIDVWEPVRVTGRILGVLVLCTAGIVGAACIVPLTYISEPWACGLHKRFSRAWLRTALRLIGARVTVRGKKPDSPFFLVGNHISWIDFLVTNTVVDAVCVTEEIIQRIPLARLILGGLELIVIRRVKGELLETNQEISKAIAAGKSIVMAPEATVTPGLRVCHFHSALLEPAVRAERPVHYASLTIRTPEGCTPASRAVLSPDPNFSPRDITSEEAELQRCGLEKGFLRYFIGLMALPSHEFIVTFGDEPIRGADRKQLARDLRQAVQSIFTPIE